jgi:hypothetical protein
MSICVDVNLSYTNTTAIILFLLLVKHVRKLGGVL